MNRHEMWKGLPLSGYLNLFWDRITSSRITTIFFLYSLLHCCMQVGLQTDAFLVNKEAATLLDKIIVQGNATMSGFPVFSGDLRECNDIPHKVSPALCQVVWSPHDNSTSTAPPTPSSTALAMTSSTSSLSPATVSVQTTHVSVPTAVAVFTNAVSPDSSTPTVPTTTKTVIQVATSTSVPQTDTTTDSDANDTGSDDTAVSFNFALFSKRTAVVGDETIMATQENGSIVVTVSGFGNDGEAMTLDQTCLLALNWPVSVLLFTERQDISFIAFQIWVLGMSTVAILNESIPHILASLLTHLLATAWAAFQISNTATFHQSFASLTTNGACAGHNLLPTYWESRGNVEIAILILNVVTLLMSIFFSWKLVKSFGWQTFKRVGASLTINRLYKAVLILSINIQLSLFFMAVTVGLWLDELWNGAIGRLAENGTLYKATSIVTILLLVPWLMMGWFAVRREAKKMMAVFLILSVLYMGGWAAMLASDTFRWTFTQWQFFAVISVASVLLTLMAFIMGLICRVNFGKGLPRYLNAQQPITEDQSSSDVQGGGSGDVEKVAFPSSERPFPTFSVAFGSVPGGVTGSEMASHFRAQTMRAFDSRMVTMGSGAAANPQQHLKRHVSASSQASLQTTSSTSSQSSRRWIIE